MSLHWLPPPPGAIKVNVHGTFFPFPVANGNTMCVGAILQRANGAMSSCIFGHIPQVCPLVNQLAVIHLGMKRAYEEGATNVIVETDNLETFGVLKFPRIGLPPEARCLIQQIKILKKDTAWKCVIQYVYPRRNKVATYLALLGADLFTRLFISFEPIGRTAELMNLDVGMGPSDPRFVSAPMNEDEMEMLDQALDEGWGVANGPGHAAQFMGTVGFNEGNPGQGQEGIEIHDFIIEEEIDGDEDDVAVVASG